MDTSYIPEQAQSLIEARSWAELARTSIPWPEDSLVTPELYDLFLTLEKVDQVLFFRSLPKDLAVSVFASFDNDTAESLLKNLTDQETRNLLDELDPDDRTYLLGELPGPVTMRLLNLLSPEDLKEARALLGYPEESVGRLMSPGYIIVKPHWTLERALDQIRERGQDLETVDMIYVLDKNLVLQDALSLQRLVLADPRRHVEDIMDNSFVSIRAFEDREEAVRLMQRYNRTVLPVLDDQGHMLGIVTIDDVLVVAEEEITEDFQKSSAVAPLRADYSDSSFGKLYFSRIGWLGILVVLGMVSSGILAGFQSTLASAMVLSFFIPMIIGTGGNAGTQASGLMIRALSTGDVKLEQWFKILLQELLMGMLLGVSLGIMGMVLGYFQGGWMVGLTVLTSMTVMMIITNLLGALLPFILTSLGRDPAVASGPLIASVADGVGLVVYLSLARWILGLPSPL